MNGNVCVCIYVYIKGRKYDSTSNHEVPRLFYIFKSTYIVDPFPLERRDFCFSVFVFFLTIRVINYIDLSFDLSDSVDPAVRAE